MLSFRTTIVRVMPLTMNTIWSWREGIYNATGLQCHEGPKDRSQTPILRWDTGANRFCRGVVLMKESPKCLKRFASQLPRYRQVRVVRHCIPADGSIQECTSPRACAGWVGLARYLESSRCSSQTATQSPAYGESACQIFTRWVSGDRSSLVSGSPKKRQSWSTLLSMEDENATCPQHLLSPTIYGF